MDAAQEKYLQMTQQPVEKLVCRLAVPSILSMMVSAFYNMADTFFIGKISTQATGAVGVVFSYMALIQAIGFFFGHGSGNYISRALGRRRPAQPGAAGPCQPGHRLPEPGSRGMGRFGHRRLLGGEPDHLYGLFGPAGLRPGFSAGMRLQLRGRAVWPGKTGLLVLRKGLLPAALRHGAGGTALCRTPGGRLPGQRRPADRDRCRALRCQALSFPLLGWITMVNMTLQTARKTRQATIVAISRQGIVFIPVLFIATRLWGLWGVILAPPLSDLFSFFLAIPLARGFLRSLDQPPAQTS